MDMKKKFSFFLLSVQSKCICITDTNLTFDDMLYTASINRGPYVKFLSNTFSMQKKWYVIEAALLTPKIIKCDEDRKILGFMKNACLAV